MDIFAIVNNVIECILHYSPLILLLAFITTLVIPFLRNPFLNTLKKHWYSSIAIVISLIVLSISCPRKNLSLDYIGIIVGVLALLTTILIGWQIYNVISFEKRLNELKSQLEKKIQDEIEKAKYELQNFTLYNFMVSHSQISLERTDYEDAFLCYINAIESALNLDSDDLVNPIVPSIVSLTKKGNFKISIDKQERIVNILLKAKNERLANIIPVLREKHFEKDNDQPIQS